MAGAEPRGMLTPGRPLHRRDDAPVTERVAVNSLAAGAGFVEVEKTRLGRWMRKIAFWVPGNVVETTSRRRRLRKIGPRQASKPPKVAGWQRGSYPPSKPLYVNPI
jgi:hypothetical protein